MTTIREMEGHLAVVLRQFLAGCMALALAACANSSGQLISTGERYREAADLSEVYLLGPGDKVRVTVFNEPSLSGEFSVDAEGRLAVPLVGDLPANDRTTRMIADDYARRLADGYLYSPRVSMEVITYRPFFILGEVATPGQYPYAAGMTVLNAIATAEGFTPRAKRSTVFIRRAGEKGELEYALTPTLRVMPGDTIRLAERYF